MALTPGELAEHDQAWAEAGRRLDAAIDAHLDFRAEAERWNGDLTGLLGFITHHLDADDVALMLAVAIDRLAAIDEATS